MIPFKMLLLQYWNVIIGERMHFTAKLQNNSSVDRIQVVSPECISIMSKYTIENCPGPKSVYRFTKIGSLISKHGYNMASILQLCGK